MKIEKGKISGLHLMFSVSCFLQASTLLTSFFVSISKRDSWIAVLLACVAFLPVLWVYLRLMESHPGKNLFEINDAVFGRIAGRIISAIYTSFFLTLTSLNLRDMGDFVKQTIMSRTPYVVLIGICMVMSAWDVHSGGLRQITKFGFAFTVTSLFIVIFTTVQTAGQMDLNNFLPMFDMPLETYAHSANIILTIPFAELIVFLPIFCNMENPKQKLRKYVFGGFAIGGATLLLVTLRDTAVLGNTMDFFAMPAFETLRMVSLTQTLSRMEILFAFILITLLFFKITWLYYITVISTAQVLNFRDYRQLVLPVGMIVTVYSFILYPNVLAHIASGREIAPLLWLVCEVFLPAVTLLVGKIKKAIRSARPSGGGTVAPASNNDPSF